MSKSFKASIITFIALCFFGILSTIPYKSPLAQLDHDVFVQTASVTVATTAAETTLIGAGSGSVTLPADYLKKGTTLRIVALGNYGTLAVPGTFNFRVKLGGTTIGTTGDFTPVVSGSAQIWKVETVLTVRTTGVSGTVFAQGYLLVQSAVIALPTMSAANLVPMNNTATTTINTTTANAIDFTADWQTSSGSNTVTCTNLWIKRET